jgi:hypothetical protein
MIFIMFASDDGHHVYVKRVSIPEGWPCAAHVKLQRKAAVEFWLKPGG